MKAAENVEKGAPSPAGLRSVITLAALVAAISCLLLWVFQPRTNTSVVPLLIRPSSDGQFHVMNAGEGRFSVVITGGQAQSETGEPVADVDIRYKYSGLLSKLDLKDVLSGGDWMSPGGVGPALPHAARQLPPGAYVVEITGSDGHGTIYAGAQSLTAQ